MHCLSMNCAIDPKMEHGASFLNTLGGVKGDRVRRFEAFDDEKRG
jgi:hypothetical protein